MRSLQRAPLLSCHRWEGHRQAQKEVWMFAEGSNIAWLLHEGQWPRFVFVYYHWSSWHRCKHLIWIEVCMEEALASACPGHRVLIKLCCPRGLSWGGALNSSKVYVVVPSVWVIHQRSHLQQKEVLANSAVVNSLLSSPSPKLTGSNGIF